MKFVLHEIKLWFLQEDIEPISYTFLPNKVNVITGDATTGKTSFWSIIDYCFLSGRVMIANTINDNIMWYGVRFTLDNEEIMIIRKSPSKGAVSSDVFYSNEGFPVKPSSNIEIAELKSILDNKFGITDSLRFPYGKELGKTSFNLSYRHFLLFNALTETIIGAPETYFDTTFFGKEEYDNALSHIFELVIGVNDMENIKAKERLDIIEKELQKISTQEKKNQNKIKNFEKSVIQLVDKCKKNNFIDYEQIFESSDDALFYIEDVISNIKKVATNSKLFSEIDSLKRTQTEILAQISSINRYKREYDTYKRNLKKSADSLQPIEFLHKNLSDQLVDSYETNAFIESLSASLVEIKNSLPKKAIEPIKVTGDIKDLQKQLEIIDKRVHHLNEINKNYQKAGEKFIVLGEIKFSYEQILKMPGIKPIDTINLNRLNEEKGSLMKVPKENEHIKRSMKILLNESIQRNYNLLKSLPAYKNSRTEFNELEMILQLYPEGEMFPLNNVGSKSNYMFMHLCVFLGLHEHMINAGQIHVPQFLFIDQPSIPYYSGGEEKGNDDKTKLIDAFSLLNSFVENIIMNKHNDFQIFMVEHASKDYWIDNELQHFHTVDEFINGKGLIPKNIFKS